MCPKRWYLALWAELFLKGVVVDDEAQIWEWKAPPHNSQILA